jgi:hypothetical protein
MRDVVAGGLLRFRVPTRWREEPRTGDSLVFQTGGPASPVLRVHVSTLDGPQAADATAVQDVLRGLRPGRETVIQAPPGGPAILKCVEAVRETGRDQAAYEWHLAEALPPRQVRLARFRLTVPMESADELIVQSDVSLLDREVRAARFVAAG